MIDALDALGAAALPVLWLPLAAWTLLWLLAELVLRLSMGVHPLVRYRAVQALMVSLPIGLAVGAMVEVPALLPAAAQVALPDGLAAPLPVVAPAAEIPVFAPEASAPVIGPGVLAGLLVFLAGLVAGVQILRLAAHRVALGRMRRALRPVTEPALASEARAAAEWLGVRRSVEVASCTSVAVPMTFGLRKPLIALPASLSSDERRLAILHEMVHVRHGDYLARWVEALLSACFALHPGMHRLRRHGELLREMACDAALIGEASVSRREYARLVFAFVCPPARQAPATVGMSDRRSHVTKRLRAMNALSPSTPAPRGLAAAAALAVLLSGSALLTASHALAQAEGSAIDRTELDGFQFTVYASEERVRLVCEFGCAWTDLSFALSPGGVPQVVDFFGVGGSAEQGDPSGERRFVVAVQRMADDVAMTCGSGCAWRDLRFTCRSGACAQSIDARGMVDTAATLPHPRGDAAGTWLQEHAHGVTIHTAPRAGQGPPPLVILDGERAPFERLVALQRDGVIGSIDVLKREVAVERYGEEASRGVLVVTTQSATLSEPSDGPRMQVIPVRFHLTPAADGLHEIRADGQVMRGPERVENAEVYLHGLPHRVGPSRTGSNGWFSIVSAPVRVEAPLRIEVRHAVYGTLTVPFEPHGPPAAAVRDDTTFVVVEEMPEPIGGLPAIQERVRYPELARRAGIEGTAYVLFVVNEDGSVTEARCTRDPGAGTCEAAIAAVQATEFRPGRQRGRAARVRFSLPVRFMLPSEADSEPSGEQMSVRVEVDRERVRGTLVIRGEVVDVASGRPLAGANAHFVSGQRIVGAATGPDGRFSIRVDEDVVLREGAPLRVTFAGREAVEVDLRGHAGVRADLEAGAVEFSVSGVHPQPSGNEVLITFSLPEDADVRVEVFDMAGRRVMQVPGSRISAGANRFVSVDARRLASGTYAYRLVAEMDSGTRSASGRFTIVR